MTIAVPFRTVLDAANSLGLNWQEVDGGYAQGQCPTHASDVPLLVTHEPNGVSIDCPGGCSEVGVLAALELVPDGVTMRLTRLADVQAERVDWLWPGRIPRGKLVTLDGDPGLGKSTLAIHLAAIITTAGRWPDGASCDHPGAVLLMSAEDGLADTVRPRADAAGADVSRVHAIDGIPEADGKTLRPPTLADVLGIEGAIKRTGAAMLVVDVIMAYLPNGTDSHKDQDVRRVLSALAAVADRTSCTVLLIRHLNKAKGGDPLYRGGGSIGIVGAARAGLLVAADPDDPERRVLASVKSNLGPPVESLTYRLVGAGEHGAARVQWEGVSAHDARALLADSGGDEDGDGSQIAKIIRDYLTNPEGGCGSAPAGDVLKHTRAAGYADAAVKKARSKAGVSTRREGFGKEGKWLWSIETPKGALDNRHSETGPMAPMTESMPEEPEAAAPREADPEHPQQTPHIEGNPAT